MRAIKAADIERRIGFGVTLGLRLFQDVAKRALLALHFGQDVIAGAVQDAVDARHVVGTKRLSERLDNRNTACNCGFEIQRYAVFFGELGKLKAVFRQHRFVRCDDVFARLKRGFDGGFGNAALPADELDKDRVRGIARKRNGVCKPLGFGRHRAFLLGLRFGGNAAHFNSAPRNFAKPIAMCAKQFKQAAADCAEAGDANSKSFGHGRRLPAFAF